MRDGMVSTALEVVGMGVILVSAFLFNVLFGAAVAGALLVVAGVILGDRTRL